MFFITLVVYLLIQIAIELITVCSLEINDVGVCRAHSRNETKALYCCQNFKENRKDDKCEACPSGTFGINCKNVCVKGYYGVGCNSSCNCSVEMCDGKKGCTLYMNGGMKTKRNNGIIIGCVVLLLLILSITILSVLRRTGGNMTFFRMIIKRPRQLFICNSSSFEMTSDENFYAAIRVSAIIDTYRPTAIQIHDIPHDDEQYIFRQGNHSTRSNTLIYSVAKPLRNTSILSHETSKTRTTFVCPESVVHTPNDTSQENKEVSECDKPSLLVIKDESLNELHKASTC